MAAMSETIKDFVEHCIKSSVDYPDDVKISVSVSTKAIIAQIKVARVDCGKVIGKRGRTIDALKVMCSNVKNTKFPDDSRRVMLEVIEDEDTDFSYNK